MNDRYLFKAKRIDNGEWIVGNLIQTPFMGVVRSWISSKEADKERLRSVATYKTEWRAIEVRTDSVCQCTGLKDENGTLIRENDIVYARCNGLSGKGVVKFENGCFVLKDRKRNRTYSLFGEWKFRVDGNIFDNPRLLEVE